jgi:hypothetical protein
VADKAGPAFAFQKSTNARLSESRNDLECHDR